MKRVRLAVAVLIVAAAAALVLWRGRSPELRASPGPGAGPQPVGVDYRLAPIAAAMHAPDGATPCETAYNALSALDETARGRSQATPWKTLADRGTFLARCAALPTQDQQCLGPRYQARHHDVCDPLLQRYPATSPLFEGAGKP